MDGVTHVVHPAALCALVAEKLTVKSVSHLYQVCRPRDCTLHSCPILGLLVPPSFHVLLLLTTASLAALLVILSQLCFGKPLDTFSASWQNTAHRR